MANFNNMLPIDFVNNQDMRNNGAMSSQDHRKEYFEQQQQIKVIKPLGSQAGIAKSDFDISLDENSQQWFNHINQYYKQCKLHILSTSKKKQKIISIYFFCCVLNFTFTSQIRNRQCYLR